MMVSFLSKYKQYGIHIIHNGWTRGGRGSVGLRNDVSSRGSLSQRRRGETRVGTPSKIWKIEETSFMNGPKDIKCMK